MTRDDLILKFLTIEKECGYTKKIIWQFIRVEVFRYIEDDLFSTQCEPIYLRQPIKNLSLPIVPDEQRDILVLNSYDRYVNIDGVSFCPATGGVVAYYPQNHFQIGVSFKNRCFYNNSERALSIDVSSCPESRIQVDINDSDVIRFLRLMAYQYKEIDKIKSRIANLLKYITCVIQMENDWIRIFRTLAPKVLVVSSGYNPFFKMAVLVANSLGITTVEAQHGHINKCHIAYNTLDKSKGACLSVPQYMFVYGENYKNSGRFYQSLKHIIPVGNYCAEYAKSKICRDSNDAYDIIFVSATNSNVVKKYAIALAESRPDLKIKYRFHPEERVDEAYITELQAHNIAIEYPNQCSIYVTLTEAKTVVTYNSTVTFEALALGKIVIVISDTLIKVDSSIKSLVYEITQIHELIEVLKKPFNKTETNFRDYSNCNYKENLKCAMVQVGIS